MHAAHERGSQQSSVDSVYQHVAARQQALGARGIELSAWRIQRRVGMSGGCTP
jgi:hypothetical protein